MEGIRLLKMQFRPAPTPAERKKIQKQLTDFFADLTTIAIKSLRPRRSPLTRIYLNEAAEDGNVNDFADVGETASTWEWIDGAHIVYYGELTESADWNFLAAFLRKEFNPVAVDWTNVDDADGVTALARGFRLGEQRLFPLNRKDWALLQSLLRRDGQTRSKELLAWMKAVQTTPR